MRVTSVDIKSEDPFPRLNFPTTSSSKKKGNFVTVLLGPNGTFKSYVLGKMAEARRRNLNTSRAANIVLDGDFSRVICISNGTHDRFPLPKRDFADVLREAAADSEKEQKNVYYYLGSRTQGRMIDPERIVYRLLYYLMDTWSWSENPTDLAAVFQKCGFKPELNLRIEFKSKSLLEKVGELNEGNLVEYLLNQTTNNYAKRLDLLRDQPKVLKFILENLKSASQHRASDVSISRSIDFKKSANTVNFFRGEFLLYVLMKELGLARMTEIGVARKSEHGFFNFLDCSSGEIKRLSILLSVAAVASDDSLILIDEPELSLHPSWQIDFIKDLTQVLTFAKGCHVFIASHSPYLVADLPPDLSCVVTLQRKGDGVRVELIDWPTFGWSVEKVLIDVFGVSTVRNKYLEFRVRRLVKFISDQRKRRDSPDEIRRVVDQLSEFVRDDEDPLHALLDDTREFLRKQG